MATAVGGEFNLGYCLSAYFFLATTLIRLLIRLKGSTQRRALEGCRRAAWVCPRPQGWFEGMYGSPVSSMQWKNIFKFQRKHLTTFGNMLSQKLKGKTLS